MEMKKMEENSNLLKEDKIFIKFKPKDEWEEFEVVEHFGNILTIKNYQEERMVFLDEIFAIIRKSENYKEPEDGGIYLGTVQADGTIKEE